MKAKQYNGWTNYETWLVKLWMDNDQGSSEYWAEQAENAVADAQGDEPELCKLADQLKDEHEQALPELSGFAADLMNAAMSEVNWFEIAEALITDANANLVKSPL